MATPSPALDDEITALSLQLEDLDYLSHDEKDPVAHSKDFDEARATYRAELEHRLSILQDRKHAQRIARAIIADSPAIAYLLIQDRQARQDRNVALQMSGLTLEIEDTLPDDEVCLKP
jgi:hypothetical protein